MPPETIVLAWDPLYKEPTITLSNSNKTATSTTASVIVLGTVPKASPATIPYGPWWYFEVTITSPTTLIGICEETESFGLISNLGFNVAVTGQTKSCGWYASTGWFYRDNALAISTGTTAVAGDVIGVAYSMNNSTARIKYYKNGVAFGAEYLASFFTGNFRPAVDLNSGGISATISNNIYATPADTNKLGL